MSSVVISGDTSGAITVAAPAIAGTNTITLPAGTGTAAVNGVNGVLVSGTAQNPSSSTTVPFNSVPSWVKRISLVWSNLGTNGTSNLQAQIGSGSYTTSGYSSNMWQGSTSSGIITTGFILVTMPTSGAITTGCVVLYNTTGNTWVASVNSSYNTVSSLGWVGSGWITLGGTLDRIRLNTINGTDIFDAGFVNIMYE